MRVEFAKLIDKKVVPVSSLFELEDFLTHFDKRRVALTEIGDANVSTVFLAINHSFGEGPGLWFETMIFGGDHDGYQERYETYEQAEEGHKRAIEMAQEKLK